VKLTSDLNQMPRYTVSGVELYFCDSYCFISLCLGTDTILSVSEGPCRQQVLRLTETVCIVT
jgi:hypothetical protein